MVTEKLIEQFKDRNRIFHYEDDNIRELLSFSIAYIRSRCGEFDIDGKSDEDKEAKELVLERTRYAYNDAVEFFEDNFLSEITALGISLGTREGDIHEV